MDLGQLRQRVADAKAAHRQLKAQLKAREAEVYGALGRFAMLPVEIVFAILDALFMAELREYPPVCWTLEPDRPPVSAFRFFLTCADARALRNDWCVHAYRLLGGAENVVDGWQWMQHWLPDVVSFITNSEAALVFCTGIIPERGRLGEVTHANFCDPRRLQTVAARWHSDAVNACPNTAAYLLRFPETRHEFVGLLARTGASKALGPGVWLGALRCLPVPDAVQILSRFDEAGAITALCAADRHTWAQFFVHNLLDSKDTRLANLVALLGVYQSGWFQCWDDMGLVGAIKTCTSERVMAMVEHAPVELLGLPQRAPGDAGPGRSSFVRGHVAAMMQSPHWHRVPLSGIYHPKLRCLVVYTRIRQCGGRIHPSALMCSAGNLHDLEGCLPLVERVEPSGRALGVLKRMLGNNARNAKLVKAVCVHCCVDFVSLSRE